MKSDLENLCEGLWDNREWMFDKGTNGGVFGHEKAKLVSAEQTRRTEYGTYHLNLLCYYKTFRTQGYDPKEASERAINACPMKHFRRDYT